MQTYCIRPALFSHSRHYTENQPMINIYSIQGFHVIDSNTLVHDIYNLSRKKHIFASEDEMHVLEEYKKICAVSLVG